MFEKSGKKEEEKPKVIPKKIQINDFLKNMQEENRKKESFRRLSFRGQLNFESKIKEKLLALNTTTGEKKEEKIIPKKIDMEKQSELMRQSLKSARKSQDESLKNPPKKICMEDYLKKLNNSNKKYTVIKRKIPKKLDTEKILKDMIDSQKTKNENNVENDEDNFENLTIRNRRDTVSDRLKNIKNAELERKKKIEEDKRLIEEDRERIREERKRREEERKRREEERRKKEEEERKEREKREEEERKIREEEENLKKEALRKINKKEEDLSESELRRLIESERYEKLVKDYMEIRQRKYMNDYEGIDIRFTFEEIKEISTDSLNDLEVTKTGKMLSENMLTL